MSEQNLIQKLKSGDLSAVDDLFHIYADNAVKTAYLITSDRFLAEDVVQETFIICLNKINSLQNDLAFKSWFYRILIRTAYKEIKKKKRIIPTESIDNDSIHNDTYFDESSELYDAIMKLDVKHRTVVILYYYNELSIKEISRITKSREGTVKSRLAYARKKLKSMISEMEEYQWIAR